MHSHVAKTVKYNFGHFSLVKSQYLLEPCVPRVQFIVMGISDEQRPRTTMVQSRIGDALKKLIIQPAREAGGPEGPARCER